MAIYLEVDGMQGSVTTQGFENQSELNSFQWGVSRSIGTAASGATARESSNPTVSEITVTKLADAASPDLANYALAGQLNKKFTIHFTTTTAGQVTEFLKHELENVGLSQFSVSSGGDLPMESMALNFTKITTTFTPMDPSVAGNNKVVSYDLTTMTGSAS
jgi:type VI secretion system secreted protein Hcp